MAIVLNDPTAQGWSNVANLLGQFIGNFGANYIMNKDILDKINQNIVGKDVYNQVKETLGEGVADMIFTPTDEGYEFNVNTLADLMRNSEEYSNNPVLKTLFELGKARQSFADKNIIAQLKAISDPTVASALAITGSDLEKALQKSEQQKLLKEFIPKVLGLPEEYSPIYDIIMKDASLSPILFLTLMNKYTGE